ncbi:RNA polymerase sigma-70 factor, ECF subfamily [Rubritalea squalenifaciens DSM 18772]|uniref:RNA polymerase sigma-70 factor, ECF subfamily n=1 Tax=Rubritalea squalenifaciens DSM 18772 TaxID=1123071 RepID=A0A1M6LLY0_9BACT|nr:sigma-70 family RNA polymerase sigma factor [Rubritalea squalenifaciens]SHJ72187.1 RNA polymerase sigma-70 factor, ECF subfamily [Rubritalea squalenifaciens DSM 18772]
MGIFSGSTDDAIVTQIAVHQAELLAYIHSLLPGDPSVQDVLQRTNLVIWKKRKNFEKGTNFRAWAYSIARWEVKSYLKECQRKDWLVIHDDLAKKITESMEESTEETPTHDLRVALDHCLQKLNPSERELITHRYYSETPLKEYAQSSGKSVGSLKVTLSRLRTALRRCIDERQTLDKIIPS